MKTQYAFPATVAVLLHAVLLALIVVFGGGKDSPPNQEAKTAGLESPSASGETRDVTPPSMEKAAEKPPKIQKPKESPPAPPPPAEAAPVAKTVVSKEKTPENQPKIHKPKESPPASSPPAEVASVAKPAASIGKKPDQNRPAAQKGVTRPAEIKKGKRVVRNFNVPANGDDSLVDDRIKLKDGELASWLGDRKRIETKNISEER